MASPIKILLCCASEDQRLRDDLAKHLKPLARNQVITMLHEQPLAPGSNEAAQLRCWADEADVILLLLSKDLIATLEDHIVVARGLERYRLDEVQLIPVILYEVSWREDKHFGGLVPLPRDGQPVGEGSRAARDAALVKVVEGVKDVALQVQRKRRQELGRWQQIEDDLRARQVQAQLLLPQLLAMQPTKPATLDLAKGRALLIGVGADLPVTAQDAQGIYEVLIDSASAHYPQSQVTLLTEKEASRAKILAALDELGAQASPEDTVFIFFSGHGWRTDPSVPVCSLVPNDYFPTRSRAALISGAEFAQRILAIKSQKLLLFLDCCFAGAIPAKGPGDPGGTSVKSVPIPMELLYRLESGAGRVVMASSQPHEVSLAGNPYSVFTASLLEALRTLGGPDCCVRVLDVIKYLFEVVPQRSGGKQHPYLTNLSGLSENFVLCYASASGGSKVKDRASICSPLLAPAPEDGKIPTRSSLRQLLDAVLHNDPRLEAFCLDEYPAVKRQFSQGMLRDAKVTLLLEDPNLEELLRRLKEWDGKKVVQHWGLLKFKKE